MSDTEHLPPPVIDTVVIGPADESEDSLIEAVLSVSVSRPVLETEKPLVDLKRCDVVS